MKKILITFRKNAENSGPYQSHKRIIESELKDKYIFEPLYLPIPKKLLNPKILIKFIQEIKKCNPDILHVYGLQLDGFFQVLIGKLAGVKKIVCTVRGSSNEAIDFPYWKKYIVDKLEKWTLKHSDMVYGVSDYVSSWSQVKKYSKHYYGTIYNFPDIFEKINEEQVFINRKKIRNELNIKKDSIVVISTGRITKEKGYETICRIIIDNSEKLNGVIFLIVGKGEYLSEMKDKLSEYKNVIFTGYRSDISEILDASDIFISASKHETLGNSIIEAEYHGLPVVASKVGGIPELIVDENTGFLVNIDDEKMFAKRIIKLITDSTLRKKMGIESKNYINKVLNVSEIKNSLEKMYEDTLNL